MPVVQEVPVDAIKIDGGTQSRKGVNAETVSEYAEAMREGDKFPAIDVYFDGSDYWPANGFHRILAATAAGKNSIKSNLHTGTRLDAMLHAAGANATHGLRRSPQDKRFAVEMLLNEGKWGDKSIAWFAKQCRVSFHLAKSVYDQWHESQEVEPPKIRIGKDGKEHNTESATNRGADPIAREGQRNTPPPKDHENPSRDCRKDSIGNTVPEHLEGAHIATTDGRGIVQELGKLKARINGFATSPAGHFFLKHHRDTERCVTQAITNVKFCLYHSECPDCMDVEPSKGCKLCQGAGWINRDAFNTLSDIQRKKLGQAPF